MSDRFETDPAHGPEIATLTVVLLTASSSSAVLLLWVSCIEKYKNLE